ncbi:MAG: Fe-S cluster assembly protein SufD, partial [Candidatus Eisenbacteria bacterium]|nr:Fe-S cluster assembly protein SufD [Candidatus Eisenbacteria bacterium]
VATGVVRVLHVATQFSTEGSERRMTPPMAPSMVHPRSLIVVDESSEITVIEDRVSLGAQPALVNAVTEIVVGANARVHYYNLARENKASLAVASVYASQARDSHFASHTALLGGRLIRSNIYPVLNGEGCTSLLNGFYIPTGSQQHDTNMIVRHAAPHGRSRQFYRGILADQSRAVFSGRIIVEEGAQQTDARQTDMNLLLSNEAVVDTKPQLEIYTDDVKCTHGATVGQLDPDAVFYLKARGIPEEQARGLLVFAFVNEVLDRMELGPVRDGLAAQLRERLAGTEQ